MNEQLPDSPAELTWSIAYRGPAPQIAKNSYGQPAWQYWGSGTTPAEAMAALRQSIEAERDRALEHASAQVNAAAFVLATEALLPDAS